MSMVANWDFMITYTPLHPEKQDALDLYRELYTQVKRALVTRLDDTQFFLLWEGDGSTDFIVVTPGPDGRVRYSYLKDSAWSWVFDEELMEELL